jgi:phosphatidylglycerophosphate synthase
MSTAKRELKFLLAEPERRVLISIARRLPRVVTSDHLTTIGVLGSLGAGVAYALSDRSPAWLLLASAMIAVNWFGDSLDGTLARVRKTERPRYGYYLDHIVDAFSTAAIGVGIGLSPFADLSVALVLVVAYLALSINVYLESAVFGVFELAYGRIGPTEARLILMLGNVLLALGTVAGVAPQSMAWVANGIAGLLAAGMVVVLLGRFGRNLKRLAAAEPLSPGQG